MRLRFFLILFIIMSVTVALEGVLQYSFLRSERLRHIDQQIGTVASTLIASGLSVDLLDNIDEVDDIIKDALDDDRIDQSINIYSEEGVLLYGNETAKRLSLPLHKDQKWEDVEDSGHVLRTLTLKNGELYIQVSLILDSTLHRWSIGNMRLIYFIAVTLLLVMGTSLLSVKFLFSPIRKLAGEFKFLTATIQRQLGQPLTDFVIPNALQKYAKSKPSKDELQQLSAEIKKFLEMLRDYTKNFQAQTALLTHEIKTPLTVIMNRLEEIQKSDQPKAAELVAQAQSEVRDLARMVNSYMQWAVFTSSPADPEQVFAIKLSEVIRETVMSLNSIYRNRVKLLELDEVTVFAHPEHVKQVVKNILENALKYSNDSEVAIKVNGDILNVTDRGQGIPKDVMALLGSPFNKAKSSQSSHSSGLGLAWVQAVCQKYGWKLAIETSANGTSINIKFNLI